MQTAKKQWLTRKVISEMKSRPGQGLTVISKKIRLKQNDHASRRTQRSPHTRREQHPSTLAVRSTPSTLAARSTQSTLAASSTPNRPDRRMNHRAAIATSAEDHD